jgi:hypothetical protein
MYLVPQFRRGILAAPDKSADKCDSVLYQMQYMLTYMQESLKRSFNTTMFCRSYKDMDGQPVDPRVQMDANEFFNTLFDKLDDRLKGTPQV